MTEPGIRKHIHGTKQGEVKSYWFKTFSHKSFSIIWDLFYDTVLLRKLSIRGLAYREIGDGSDLSFLFYSIQNKNDQTSTYSTHSVMTRIK